MKTITGRRSPDQHNNHHDEKDDGDDDDDDWLVLAQYKKPLALSVCVSIQRHWSCCLHSWLKVGKKLRMSKGNKGFAGGKYFENRFASTQDFLASGLWPTNQPTNQATNQARERWKDLPFVTDLWWKDALLAFCLVFYTTIQVELFNHSFHIVRFSTLSVCFALITFILMMMTTLSIMIMVMTMKMTWAPFPGMREVDVECETIFSLPGQPSSGWLFLIKFSMGEHHHILLKIIINSLSLLHSLC